ncbi:hypothetical protein [Rossellomorea sp. BNER]|uniref:hypothetical protein n=1 Tax=Rossellomorea sp. BNER TaxID=2962031 RepID=UPI003AF2A30F|nr:hypothetical protein [Rossellomorea sp. BNER]
MPRKATSGKMTVSKGTDHSVKCHKWENDGIQRDRSFRENATNGKMTSLKSPIKAD